MSLHYDQHEWQRAHDDIRLSAARYGLHVAGLGEYADGARNVAWMRRDAVYAIDLDNTDYEAWRRLRREADAVLALWDSVSSPP